MPAPAAKSLAITGLQKSFGMPGGRRVEAVRDFSLHIDAGEFVTLLGPSGCGKTTVLRAIAGLETADAGEVVLDGKPIQALPSHRRRVGMVFQNYALFPHMTVAENVAYSLRIRKMGSEAIRRAVDGAVALVGLEGMQARQPGQLSGGQQQRVALARALVMEPDLLLFDEPLSNLDAKLRVQVRGELRRLQKRLGTTALYVTHDQDEAMSLSDRIAVMNAGRLEQVDTPERIYAQPASLFVADFVGQVNALPGRVVSRQNGTITVQTLGQELTLRHAEDVGDDVLVIVRPEALRVSPVSDAGEVAGTVEEVEYRGDRLEYRVRVAGALVVAIEPALGGRRMGPGERVRVDLVTDAAHLLPASKA